MAVIISNNPRRKSDFYPTPYGLCDYAINSIIERYSLSEYTILDPGAGEGRWGVFARKRWPNAYIEGIDIEDHTKLKDNLTKIYNTYRNKQDFLSYNYDRKFELIIGNPPFSLAEEFIRKSFYLLNPMGCILFLLKLDFLAGIERAKTFFNNLPPREVWICSRRPSFNTPKNRRTDSSAYAIYLWQKGWDYSPNIKWLDWKYDKELDYDKNDS
jgi:hypothetical protein